MRVLAEVRFSTFCTYYWWKGDERVSRIELPSLAWEANALTVVLYPQMTAGTVTLRLSPWDASFIKASGGYVRKRVSMFYPIKLTLSVSHACRVQGSNLQLLFCRKMFENQLLYVSLNWLWRAIGESNPYHMIDSHVS